MQPHIYVIGFMGSGKTTVAKEAKKLFEYPFIEMDQAIEQQEGMTINEIFAQKGEEYFRNAETEFLKKLDDQPTAFVSCGGGVVLRPENVEIMKKNGIIILLEASAQTIYDRVKNTSNRPLLKDRMSVAGIQELMDQRMDAYLNAADGVVNVDNMPIREAAENLAGAYVAIRSKRNRDANRELKLSQEEVYQFAHKAPDSINKIDPKDWKMYM